MKKLRHALPMVFFMISLPVFTVAEEHAHENQHEEGEHAEEGGAAIGPEKGITEKGKLGFRLSPEAAQSFELRYQEFTSSVATIEPSALVKVKESKSIFRQREGWFKRIAVEIISRKGNAIVVRSSQLQAGDKIVTEGAAYLRTAEIIGEEGASHSH